MGVHHVLKLTSGRTADGDASVRIEGRLDGSTLRELMSVLGAMPSDVRCTLDLSGLASVDPTGVSALVRLAGEGHRIVGASLYINQCLEEAQP